MSFSALGKNAIVTGASSGMHDPLVPLTSDHLITLITEVGINLAFAKLLAKKGAHVVVADVQETPAFRIFQQEPKSTKVLFHKTDVSSWKDLENLFTFAKTELGPIDILCNGAGVFEPV
jgi:NAD(P)-dependent dehydrogenase (short-subunit alcohol dehydrogenase family)